MLSVYTDNIFTGFPQKLWKTLKNPIVIHTCLILISIVILSSCSYFMGGKKQGKDTQNPSVTEASKQTEQKVPETSQAAPEKKVSAPLKEPPKAKLVPDSGVIDMTEAEVKRKYGEPDIVSKTPDNRILWTYQPTWKLLPDNKGTIYVEFENGKVTKIIRAR